MEVHIKGVLFGKYLWRCPDNSVVMSYTPQPWKIQWESGERAYIKRGDSHLEPEGALHSVRAKEEYPKAEFLWRIVKLDSQGFKVALQSSLNEYLSTSKDNRVHSHAKKLDVGEHFQLEFPNQPPVVGPPFVQPRTEIRCNIKSTKYGSYVHRFPDANVGLSPTPQAFQIEYLGSDQIAIKDAGSYFTGFKDGHVKATKPQREDWETFYLRPVRGSAPPAYLILTHHNTFWMNKKDNTIVLKDNYEAEAADDERYEFEIAF
jgi:hypothetical protein